MPAVTIIVATYNRSSLLRWTLESILDQDFSDFEVQVVGDSCTDNTQDVIESLDDSRIHWTNLTKRVGNQAGPNNEGLSLAKGKYIAYLGHDDLWFPWHLTHLVEIMETGAEFAFSLTALIEPPDSVRAYGTPNPRRKIDYHFAPPSSWMHHHLVPEKIGNWRTDAKNLLFDLDREFFYRTVKAGIQPHFSSDLSVIKFPSKSWKTYGLKKFPQESMAEKMRRNPHQLHTDLLTKIAIQSALHHEEKRSLVRKGLCSLLDAYGRERWPVSIWMNHKIRKELERRIEQRGLVSEFDSKSGQK